MEMTHTSSINLDYNDLVREYGGQVVLIIDNEIKFVDKSNKIVFKYAKKHYPGQIWKITRIDAGEAAFYGINISNNQNTTPKESKR